MFHFHKWTDWLTIETGKIVDYVWKKDVLGSYVTQERYCVKCGKTQLTTQKTTRKLSTVLIPEVRKVRLKHDEVKER